MLADAGNVEVNIRGQSLLVQQPYLSEIGRKVGQAADHLARAYEMLEQTTLDHLARLHLTINAAVAKIIPTISVVAAYFPAERTRS